MWQVLFDVGTLGVAVYAAIVSTVVWLATHRRSVKVTIRSGVVTRLEGIQLIISAVNNGRRPVTIVSIGIRLPEGRTLVMPIPGPFDTSLPIELSDGHEGRIITPLDHVTVEVGRAGYSGSVPIRAVASDTLGKEYLSNEQRLDVPSID